MNQDTCPYDEHSNEPIRGYCLNKSCIAQPKCCLQCLLAKHESHQYDCKGFNQIEEMISKTADSLHHLQERLDTSFQNLFIMKDGINKYLFGKLVRLIETKQYLEEKMFPEFENNLDFLREWNNINEPQSKKSFDSAMSNKLAIVNQIICKFNTLLDDAVLKQFEDIAMSECRENLLMDLQKISSNINLQANIQIAKGLNSFNLGNELKREKKWMEALSCYEEAINICSNIIEAHFEKGKNIDKLIGNILHNLKNYDEAILSYEQVIKIDPGKSDSYHNKGVILIKQGLYAESIGCFDQAIKFSPENSSAYNFKGLALDKLKRFDEAIQCFDLAIKFDPNQRSTEK